MGIFDFFKTIILVQLFWAFGVTIIASTIPTQDLKIINPFQTVISTDMSSTTAQIEGAISNQTSLPLLDVGALVYFSGNFLLSLMVNFVTAIPSIITMVIDVGLKLLSIDVFFAQKIKIFIWVSVTALYVLSLLAMIMNIRSGGGTIR